MAERSPTDTEEEAEAEGLQAPADEHENDLYKKLKEMSLLSTASAFPNVVEAHKMKEPMCLIENKPGEQLQVNQEALQLLQRIRQPVVVVAIVGPYRTGKSYLMNKLAGKDKGGFSLGATLEANTKGIWMWCRPHPTKPNHTLVLLDTEGLGDVEKSNTENDSWIFALSVLLSSTFVYNSMGTINQFALEKLHYVTELTERIQVKAPGRKSKEEEYEFPDDFVWFFPSFIWAVRDFTLELELAGQPISADEYLENALRRREGSPEKLDLVKKYIRECFPNRKCFVFARPATRQELAHLEVLPEEKLNPDFVEDTRRFQIYIYETARAKVIPGGHTVTGSLLGNLAVTYVDAIRSGMVPCLESAVLALARMENSAAVQEAIKHYEEITERLLKLPTETLEELLEVHIRCESEAIRVFMARAFNDEGQEYQKELAETLHSKLQDLCSRNEQASLQRCQAVLSELFQDLEDKIASGAYSVPGGYKHFVNDQKEKLVAYQQVPGKGLMAFKALQDYLKSKESVVQSILMADRNLTDREKEIEVKLLRAQAAEQEAELQRKMKEDAIKMAKERKVGYEEHKRQLMAKMEEDRMNQQVESARMLEAKKQERMLRGGKFMSEEARMRHSEIQALIRMEEQYLKKESRAEGRACTIS